MKYEVVIGLEVHTELRTKTKIFCGCKTSFGADPNTNVCPVCLGLPGVLPVLNRKVLEFGVRAGLALNVKLSDSVNLTEKIIIIRICQKISRRLNLICRFVVLDSLMWK